MPLYEAMFMVDANLGEKWNDCETRIRTVLERAEAEPLRIKKWDDRRLMFEVGNKKRATYVLAYFNAATGAPTKIERDVKLSDDLLRVLVVRSDHTSAEQMDAEVPLNAPKVRDDEYDFQPRRPNRRDRPRDDRGPRDDRPRDDRPRDDRGPAQAQAPAPVQAAAAAEPAADPTEGR